MKFIALGVLTILAFCDADDSFGIPHRHKKPHHRVWCLNDQFTCNANQCVDNSVLCDGVNDCEDGSDENPELCKSLNPRSCILPKKTDDKSYVVNCDEHDHGKPGEYVPEMSLLSYACNPGYMREYGSERFQSFCLNSTWIPAIPSCNKMCSKLNTPNMKYKCYHNNKEIECNDEYAFGTKLHISCSLPYHHPNHDEIFCGENGEWNIKNVKCVTDCGKYSDEAEHLLKGNDLPWHVLVKRKNHDGTYYVFSGTLIAPNLVLTVARSVADLHDQKLPPEDFEVLFNNYLDEEYQKSYKVKDTFFPPQGFYSKEDITEESNDIAILYLEKKVEIDATVLPVCVDWSGIKLLPGALQSNGKLVRVGDSHDSVKPIQNEIYTLNLEAYDYKTCVSHIPNGALQYDQFCGNVTDHKTTGTSDWGSGYYVENPKDHLFYIKGVYRVAYGDEGTKVFTDVPSHIEWINAIREKIETFDEYENAESHNKESLIEGCFKPGDCSTINLNHTAHRPLHFGSLELSCDSGELHMKFSQGCQLPFKKEFNFDYEVKCPFNPQNDLEAYCKRTHEGASVPEYSTLITHCKCGYASVSKKMDKSVCFSGHWLPEPPPCKKTCRKLKPEGLHLKCTYDGKEIDCNEPLVTGTHVSSECLLGYAPESSTKMKELFCDEEGEWSGVLNKCIPVCGRSVVKNVTVSADMKLGHQEDFPWHVAIYDKTKENDLVCAGSILTENTILTAAHCFFDSNDKKRNFSDFTIVAGKTNRDFKIKDTPKTQYYDIDSLHMKNYYGEVWKYFNDLVIVKTKNKIAFNTEVYPVCMQLDKLIPSGHELQTVGWGGNEESPPSSILKVSDLPYISFSECIQKAPLSAKPYILEDKSCLGRHNESMVNFANSGSGIFYYDKNSSTYHIVGVANMKIHDFPFITVFTNTNYHSPWIRGTHNILLKMKH